jgi:hypothetical protein
MRYSASEKLEIIRLVEQSHLPVRRTLGQIGIPRSTLNICLLGSLLFGSTIALAEFNVNDALEAYDSANPNDRKTWELIFGKYREWYKLGQFGLVV